MSEMAPYGKAFRDSLKRHSVKIVGTVALMTTTLVQYASAATLNESISPIITSVTELFTPLLSLVIGAVPIIIAVSLIGFILGIFAAILSKLHI